MTYLETQLGPQNLTMGGAGPRPPLDPHLNKSSKFDIQFDILCYDLHYVEPSHPLPISGSVNHLILAPTILVSGIPSHGNLLLYGGQQFPQTSQEGPIPGSGDRVGLAFHISRLKERRDWERCGFSGTT